MQLLVWTSGSPGVCIRRLPLVRVSSNRPPVPINAGLRIERGVVLTKRDEAQMMQFCAKSLLVKYQQPVGRHRGGGHVTVPPRRVLEIL